MDWCEQTKVEPGGVCTSVKQGSHYSILPAHHCRVQGSIAINVLWKNTSAVSVQDYIIKVADKGDQTM